jgi:hypothetical protein
MRGLRAPRVATAGLALSEPTSRCRTPGRTRDSDAEGFRRLPVPGLSIDRANLRQYAATSASSEGKVFILWRRRFLPIV